MGKQRRFGPLDIFPASLSDTLFPPFRGAEEPPPDIAFDPVPRLRRRRGGWTDKRQRAFIAALACCGSVAAAARSVIDINLGSGPAFDLARHLHSTKLPFPIATGYDQAVVPDDLKAIVRLEKPFRAAELISAAASVHQAANAGNSQGRRPAT